MLSRNMLLVILTQVFMLILLSMLMMILFNMMLAGNKMLWKKRSIFFDLPYCEHNLLRHNLTMKHIEKNICNNLLGTILDVDRRSKHEKAWKHKMDTGIRHEIHVIDLPSKKSSIPHTCRTLSAFKKSFFFLQQMLKYLKAPSV